MTLHIQAANEDMAQEGFDAKRPVNPNRNRSARKVTEFTDGRPPVVQFQENFGIGKAALSRYERG